MPGFLKQTVIALLNLSGKYSSFEHVEVRIARAWQNLGPRALRNPNKTIDNVTS